MNQFVVMMDGRMMTTSDSSNRHRGRRLGLYSSAHFLLLALVVLVLFWFISFFLLTWSLHVPYMNIPLSPSALTQFVEGTVSSNNNVAANGNSSHQPKPERPLSPHNLSRTPGKVTATADVRGNLGPAAVVIQPIPGNDWLHDRWQAASNMHGKNIPGQHWIQLEFDAPILVDSIRLDWETAYASEYRIEGSMQPIITDSDVDQAWALFDASNPDDQSRRTEEKTGQSPGVKETMPLHVVHTIHSVSNGHRPVRYLRLHILKSATGWGVSLWQFDVLGYWEGQVVL